MIRTVVWGTGNVGRAAIRAVDAHPGLELAAVLVSDPAKVGRDAGRLVDEPAPQPRQDRGPGPREPGGVGAGPVGADRVQLGGEGPLRGSSAHGVVLSRPNAIHTY